MRYTVEISDTTGFDIIGYEEFDALEDALHYINAILPYVDYYEYTAIVDAIDTETGEIMCQNEYAWFVTNTGSGLIANNLYEARTAYPIPQRRE